MDNDETKKRWVKQKPVSIVYPEDYTSVVNLKRTIEEANKHYHNKTIFGSQIHPTTSGEMDVLSAKPQTQEQAEKGFDVVGLTVEYTQEDKDIWKSFFEQNAISYEEPNSLHQFMNQRFLITDPEAIRKIAVVGFDFEAADMLRAQQAELLRTAQPVIGWSRPPLK
jgi:hypothetical protein